MKGEKKRRGRGRRRREEEKEGDQAKVWNFGFLYGFYEIWHGYLGLYDD